MGQVIAQRDFEIFRPDGTPLIVTVRLGKPFREASTGDYRCPIQILGIGDESIRAPWGEDPFIALQYAIDVLGQLLDQLMMREKLEVRRHWGDPERPGWIWKYPPHQPKP